VAVRPILRFLVITCIAMLVVEVGPAAGAVQEVRPKLDRTLTLTGIAVDQCWALDVVIEDDARNA
jgi:hypothetical protein